MIRTLLVGPADPAAFENLRVTLGPVELPLEVRQILDRGLLEREVAQYRPHVILSFFAEGIRCGLENLHWDVRRRWVNYPFGFVTREHAIGAILSMYTAVIKNEVPDRNPLVSVITPTYNTGSLLLRAYDSLRGQTYREWQWLVYDDSTDTQTLDVLQMLAREDSRIQVIRGGQHSGFIGEVKRRAFRAADGEILVELDHDDELTDECLELIVEGMATHPECGFAYTECAEINIDGTPVKYGDRYAFGYGSYRPYPHMYRDKPYLVTNYPQINQKTLSHIVGMPNHARAWTKDAYRECGGHNRDVFVCDDYELLLRTFLTTRMLHIRHFGYIQYRMAGHSNAHIVRNAEIQRQVAIFSAAYADAVDRQARQILGEHFVEGANQQLNLEYRREEDLLERTGTHG